jgi:Phosphoglycerol transferase and related proteins, alkaline phosphatase superfamily
MYSRIAAGLKLILALCLLLLTQVFMYVFNPTLFSIDGFGDFFSIFFGALRYALATVVVYLSVFILMAFFPVALRQNKHYRRVQNFFYVFGVEAMLVLNCGDMGYFKFTFKRLTYDFFNYLGVGGDFKKLIPQFVRDYWYIFLLFIIMNVVFIWLKNVIDHRLSGKLENPSKKWYGANWAYFICALALALLCQRGGFQLRPLGLMQANFYSSSQNTALVLNTPFTLYRTWGKKGIEKKHYFDSEKELNSYFNPVINPALTNEDSLFTEPLQVGKTNVVVIILESFAAEYTEGYTPFLTSLAKKSITFEGYANGKRSIEGIPAVLSALPSLMDESYITSQYGSNKLASFASLLAPYGYQSAFFHGGYNGTMGFDAYTKKVGYQKYFGRREYANDKDYDGNWGIFDEPFLQYMVKKLNTFKAPFTAAVFTLSSHHPYTIPPQHKGQFPKGTMIVHETIGYSDFALKRFFESASRQPWFQNTLFIISADHSAQTQKPQYTTLLGKTRIPIIFYSPKLKHGYHYSSYIQQSDILPTAMSLINYSKPVMAFGQNAFAAGERFYMLHFNEEYMLRIGDYLCKYQEGGARAELFYLPKDPNAKQNIGQENTQLLKHFVLKTQAIIQQYNNRLITNGLTSYE